MFYKLRSTALLCLIPVLFATVSPVGGAQGVQSFNQAASFQRAAAGGTPIATADSPVWTFAIYQFKDPYEGTMREDPIAGARVIGAEIEIVNRSDQSLTVFLNNIRLRTDTNTTYPGGVVIGNPVSSEGLTSRLVEGVVEAGQATRGWVWWEVPEGETLVDVVFFPSPPPPSIIPLPLESHSAFIVGN